MKLRLHDRTWSAIASRSDTPFITALRKACEFAVEYLHAENHDFRTNGEARLLQCLGPTADVVIDVGANHGIWAREAHTLCPNATIYCFEISSDTRKRLRQKVSGFQRLLVFDFGLSDRAGSVQVKYYPERDVVTSMYNYPHPEPSVWTEERVETGDWFMDELKLNHIDLLKIDAEGSDFRVLRGFDKALSRAAISVVQFEYGYACVLARTLLLDFYEYLESKDYVLGKLHAKRVQFRPYELRHENFFGPNFVAVHRSRKDLLSLISGIDDDDKV